MRLFKDWILPGRRWEISINLLYVVIGYSVFQMGGMRLLRLHFGPISVGYWLR